MLLGEVDARIDRPEIGVFDVYVRGAERIVPQALRRIELAGLKYGLRLEQRRQLSNSFLVGSTYKGPTG